MGIDVSQFHQTFLAEAGENLADLEQGLLALESGAAPDMNAIFRAAHSIKGGAATFGFSSIADFTHIVESVLERARDGELEVTAELVTTLLTSLDIISALLDAAKDGQMTATADGQAEIFAKLEGYMNSDAAPAGNAAAAQQATPAGGPQREQRIMQIVFKPKPNLFQTGCEPQNILRELAEMGEATITCKTDRLPELEQLDASQAYLWWDVELITEATDEDLNDVFLFVEDDAEIKIETIAAIGPAPTADVPDQTLTATPMAERRTKSERRKMPDRRTASNETAYIRVDISKVDNLINLVGELVTTNAMVNQHVTNLDEDEHAQLTRANSEMGRHTRNLQEAIMSIRMLPVDFAFSRFPRMVRDTAQKLNKKVHLETIGGHTELDKTVIEQISDPLTHLVRNAVDHGIETPENRLAAGKDEVGSIQLDAFYRGGNVIIEIRDDGKGMSRSAIVAKAIEKGLTTEQEAEKLSDEEVWNFIFESGFSTAAAVTDVSGRGVGMDVVRKNIQSLGGSVSITSELGKGSCFSISLPLTLAILDGMATKVGDEIYIIPLLAILESLRPTAAMVRSVKKNVEVIDFRGEYIPLLRLAEVMRVTGGNPTTNLQEGIAVVVESENGKVALFVDDLLGEQQVVIKSIEKNYSTVQGVSGATILGDGSIALILDLSGLVRLAASEGRYVKPKNIGAIPPAATAPTFAAPKPQPEQAVEPAPAKAAEPAAKEEKQVSSPTKQEPAQPEQKKEQAQRSSATQTFEDDAVIEHY